MIEFKKMNAKEFKMFRSSTIDRFALSNITAANWEETGAQEKAGALLRHLLPDGRDTAGHRFFNITGEQGNIGTLWVYVSSNTAFLFDIMMEERFRGMGFGYQTMQTLETNLAKEGVSEIELNVFGHNTAARALYIRAGFLETDIRMKKMIFSLEEL